MATVALAGAPAATAQTPGAAAKAATGFPTTAYAELGSSMGQASHFGEIGWTDEQFGAFIDGMRAAFGGRPFAMDDMGHKLSAEMNRRISDIDAGTKTPFQGDFPLMAYSAFGSAVGAGGHFGEVGWSQDQFDAFAEGMRSAFKGKPYEVEESARQLAADMSKKISAIDAAGEPAPEPFDQGKLVQYMRDATKRYHLQLSDSGLGYNISAGQNGIRPRPGDTVVISCSAVAADGTTKLPQLSSGRIRSKLEQMFPGFREGLQMMTVGSHAIFVLPPALSFGQAQWPDGVQRGSPLVFEVTLQDVISAPAAPQN
jgi:FKBP-type peptidyl-prolyl cis-trans isomerase FkpA/FKBP-type peptidyl-prolyl cis-trans isomerase FklB